mmetsp:Transcript_863/g.1549  ORF Transcript_863/g.1549 Transcript_863/m.1549 type:complete len:277 (-) Transcript_863:700-1530(-)
MEEVGGYDVLLATEDVGRHGGLRLPEDNCVLACPLVHGVPLKGVAHLGKGVDQVPHQGWVVDELADVLHVEEVVERGGLLAQLAEGDALLVLEHEEGGGDEPIHEDLLLKLLLLVEGVGQLSSHQEVLRVLGHRVELDVVPEADGLQVLHHHLPQLLGLELGDLVDYLVETVLDDGAAHDLLVREDGVLYLPLVGDADGDDLDSEVLGLEELLGVDQHFNALVGQALGGVLAQPLDLEVLEERGELVIRHDLLEQALVDVLEGLSLSGGLAVVPHR